MSGSVQLKKYEINVWVFIGMLSLCLLLCRADIVYAQDGQQSEFQTIQHEIIIQKMKFIPDQITIYQGDKVRWVNKEKRQYHNVWFEESGEAEPDYLFPEDSYEKQFFQPGEFKYRCGPHPSMTGIISVLARNKTEFLQSATQKNTEEMMTQAREAELLYLLKQDCGSCHGMRLLGGLGPALLPENLKLYAIDDLVAVILQGLPGTAMPPWKGLLSESDARWIGEKLKTGGAL